MDRLILQYFESCCLFRIMQSNVVYVNVDYKTTLHILWWPFKHEEIRLPHQIVFAIKGVLSKEGGTKPTHNAFTRKL